MNGRTPSAKEATAADEDDGDDDAQRLYRQLEQALQDAKAHH